MILSVYGSGVTLWQCLKDSLKNDVKMNSFAKMKCIIVEMALTFKQNHEGVF